MTNGWFIVMLCINIYIICASIFNTITYNTCDTKTQIIKKKWNEKMRIYICNRYHGTTGT